MKRTFILLAASLLLGCGRTTSEPNADADEAGVDAMAPAIPSSADASGTDARAVDGAQAPDAAAVDADTCSPTTCPMGCCEHGTCLSGRPIAQGGCAGFGWQCVACTNAFPTCVGGVGCGVKSTECSPSLCPTGCCIGNGFSAQCVEGTSNAACGTGGQICSDCTGSTPPYVTPSQCKNHLCGTLTCGPNNCAGGCCLGNQCVHGSDPLACGDRGLACANCTAQGLTCQPDPAFPGRRCLPPLCSAQSCAGCCVGDLCVVGSQAVACGSGGATCTDCRAQSKACGDAGVCQ